jgi:nucleoside-diphosphate-sugar epimerase
VLICVTGGQGYIGSALVLHLRARGHDVQVIDIGYYADCTLRDGVADDRQTLTIDIRDVQPEHFAGADAVIHLAALSNDPLGDIDPALTQSINVTGTERAILAARAAGVGHFVLASSCSVYGSGSGDQLLDESAVVRPLTAYARSKVTGERILKRAVQPLAQDAPPWSNPGNRDHPFRGTALRAATVFGLSTRPRLDLVVNELVAMSVVHGAVRLRSVGSSWRPFVHVQDLCAAYTAVVESTAIPASYTRYNVGANRETHRILDVATEVSEVTNTHVEVAPNSPLDVRSYRVSFDKFAEDFPEWEPQWSIRTGVRELAAAFRAASLSHDDLDGNRFRRLPRLLEQRANGTLTADARRPSLDLSPLG